MIRYPNPVPLFSTLVICLCSLLSLVSAVPSFPKPSIYLPTLSQPNIDLNTTHPHSNLTIPDLDLPQAPHNIDCFNDTSPAVYPLDPDDCPNVIDHILHDPSGVMNVQTYSWQGEEPGSFGIPADWHVGHCQILLTTGIEGAVDEFRLVEVIIAAQRILAECVPFSKTILGGLALVGNMRGFFISVNGLPTTGRKAFKESLGVEEYEDERSS